MKIMQKAGLAIAALATVAGTAVVTAPAASAADGNVYAFEGTYNSGPYCAWSGDDGDWSTCSGGGVNRNMLNKASSLWNNGYPGSYDDVNFYYNQGQGGAWACLGNGDAWADLSLGHEIFSWGPGLAGHGGRINDDIASHKWVNYCGQA
jgi:hypothetical protein